MTEFTGEIASGGGVAIVSALLYLVQQIRKKEPTSIKENRHDGSNRLVVMEEYNSIVLPAILDICDRATQDFYNILRGYYMDFVKAKGAIPDKLQCNSRVKDFEGLLSKAVRSRLQPLALELAFQARFCLKDNEEWAIDASDSLSSAALNHIDQGWKDKHTEAHDFTLHHLEHWGQKDFLAITTTLQKEVRAVKLGSLKGIKGKEKKFRADRVLKTWQELYSLSNFSKSLRG
ncbi:MAG: hypothetical protein GY799_12330 [Desulfobulbaceae bacterium]|nr:hypothetical protein [Desulfobulbaceae bacterium]